MSFSVSLSLSFVEKARWPSATQFRDFKKDENEVYANISKNYMRLITRVAFNKTQKNTVYNSCIHSRCQQGIQYTSNKVHSRHIKVQSIKVKIPPAIKRSGCQEKEHWWFDELLSILCCNTSLYNCGVNLWTWRPGDRCAYISNNRNGT